MITFYVTRHCVNILKAIVVVFVLFVIFSFFMAVKMAIFEGKKKIIYIFS